VDDFPVCCTNFSTIKQQIAKLITLPTNGRILTHSIYDWRYFGFAQHKL